MNDNRTPLVVWFVVLGLLATVACNRDKGDENKSVASTETEGPPISPVLEDKVASVNGVPIMKERVDQRMANIQERAKQRDKTLTPEELEAERAEIIEDMIQEELLKQHVLDQRIHVSQQELDARVQQDIDRTYRSRQNLLVYLERRGIRYDEYLERMRFDIALEKVLAKSGTLEPSEEELREYYDSTKQSYYVKERAHLRVILVSVKKGASDEDAQEAKERIDSIHRLAVEPGADFAQLAREYSDDPSAKNGGDIGPVDPTKLRRTSPVMAKVVFAEPQPPEGSISEPFRTRFGYNIVLVERRLPAGVQTFEEVRESLLPSARRKKIRERKKAVARLLERDAKIVRYYRGESD